MKKISVLLVTVLLTGCMLVACGNSDNNATNQGASNNQENNQATNKEEAYTGFTFKLKGADIQLHAKMASIVDALGEEDNYFESESCAFQGLDKVYTYGSVVISTYPVDKVDYVYSIELKDDTVETPEGIYIGSSKDDVTAAYGTPSSETESAYIYKKGESQLNIMFEGDSVASIVYMAITE